MVASFGIFPCDLPVRTLLGARRRVARSQRVPPKCDMTCMLLQFKPSTYNMRSYHIISASWVFYLQTKKYGFYMASILYTTIKPPVFFGEKKTTWPGAAPRLPTWRLVDWDMLGLAQLLGILISHMETVVNYTLWLWLTVCHGIDGPNRNRWFTVCRILKKWIFPWQTVK